MIQDTTDPRARRPRTVRLAIDALTPFTRQAIANAVQLALSEGGRVDCVFVEQIGLLRAAALPATRELGLGGGARPLDPAELERALRRQAQEARTLLERSAAAAGLACSFDVARGVLIEEALRRAAPHDLLVAAIAGCEPEPLPLRPPSREASLRTMLALVENPGVDLPTLRALLRSLPGITLSVWATGAAARAGEELDAQLRALEAELGRPASKLSAEQAQAGAQLAEQVGAALDRLRPQLLTMQRDMLASLAAELGWSMRRRPSLLIGIPRPNGH